VAAVGELIAHPKLPVWRPGGDPNASRGSELRSSSRFATPGRAALGFDARSLRWAWGAWGEQWTAEELAKLGSSWRAYHDIPDGRGNWDHVVVGPSGVFVIDSKHLSQPAVVDANGLRRETFGRAAARHAALLFE
jgi:hypothetical protein